jgi:hypothetical protein
MSQRRAVRHACRNVDPRLSHAVLQSRIGFHTCAPAICRDKSRSRAVSSVGRASALHAECRRFESVTAHQPFAPSQPRLAGKVNSDGCCTEAVSGGESQSPSLRLSETKSPRAKRRENSPSQDGILISNGIRTTEDGRSCAFRHRSAFFAILLRWLLSIPWKRGRRLSCWP